MEVGGINTPPFTITEMIFKKIVSAYKVVLLRKESLFTFFCLGDLRIPTQPIELLYKQQAQHIGCVPKY